MNERPILMSGPMVRATLERRKWQTRRVIVPQRTDDSGWLYHDRGRKVYAVRAGMTGMAMQAFLEQCPYGEPGACLWVRETWFKNAAGEILYRADYGPESYEGGAKGWKPSIHMPRRASRLTLEITAVRVERLQDISLDDMRAEGVRPDREASLLWRESLKANFVTLWDSLNAKRGYGWEANPWVWAIAYQPLEADE